MYYPILIQIQTTTMLNADANGDIASMLKMKISACIDFQSDGKI